MKNSICFIEERKIGRKILPVLYVVTELKIINEQVHDIEFFTHCMKYSDHIWINSLGLPIILEKDTTKPYKKLNNLREFIEWHQMNSGFNVRDYLDKLGYIKK
jgi:hypothetical protein